MTQLRAVPPPLPRIRGQRWSLVLILVALSAILPVLVIVWYAQVRVSNSKAIQKLEQEARQRGEPITLAELATNYPAIPDEENAAVALVEIWSQQEPEIWAAFKAGASVLPERRSEDFNPALPYLGRDAQRIPRDVPLTPESLAAMDEFLTAQAGHIAAVRSAFRRPRFRFDIAFGAGPAALLPHLSRIRKEARIFQIVSLAAVEHGDVTGALQAIEDSIHSGQLLAAEPTLISQLVRIACLNLALTSMEQLLSRQPLNAAQLDRLHVMLEGAGLRGAARKALVYERPYSLASFDPQVVAQSLSNPAPGDSEEEAAQAASNVRKGFTFLRATGYLAPDRRFMLETFKEAIALAEQETPDSLRQCEALFKDVAAKARRFPPKFFSAMMLPALQNVPEKFASYEARRRAALTAVAIERFRLEHEGQLPDQLAALVPRFLANPPLDPFDGEPLRFKKLDEGFAVYSVGKDRTDDDGLERARRTGDNRDVTFIVQWLSLPAATPQ